MMPLIPPPKSKSEQLYEAANAMLAALGHEPIKPPKPEPIEELEPMQ